jgi:Rps23 Pro-64 3,4-dihydroxylase Tpa1-like proline 4-hydroxylase
LLINPATWDLGALAATWRAGEPFAWVAIDSLVGDDALASLRAAIPREPHLPNRGEIFEMLVMAHDAPSQPELRAFVDALGGPAVRAAVTAVTGIDVARADGSSYIYLAGSYLLPHTDHRPGVDRKIAYVYYLSDDDAFTGGELDLYRCVVEDGEIAGTEVATTLRPRRDRLLLFAVGPTTLHRVREVRSGARVSITGWFY